MPLLLLLSLACQRSGSVKLGAGSGAPAADSGGAEDSAVRDSDDPADTGDSAEVDPDEVADPGAAAWCLDWEDGSLLNAGYEGGYVELYDGAVLTTVREGQSWSALIGEEALRLRGERALLLRSSDLGEVGSVAIATTPTFEVTGPELWWWGVSEVDARGVAFYADLMDADGRQLASVDLPVATGGFLPALPDGADPIEAIPEIGYKGARHGVLTRQVLDMSPFAGQSLRLRLYQHTRVAGSGFFTLVDDLCLGEANGDEARLAWGEPDPSHAR